jgi:hypothetical protein
MNAEEFMKKGGKVLIVEDEEAIRKSLNIQLRRTGYINVSKQSGETDGRVTPS